MGRKKKKQPKEGQRKSMKELTKDHESFMKSRNANRKEEDEEGLEKFELLISKSVKGD